MKRKKKDDNTVFWIVGGLALAFGAYEVFIKPKAVATVVPISATSTVTQAALPAPVNPVNQITSLAQTVANMVNPPAVTQQPPMTYNPGPTNTLAPSNFYVDSPTGTDTSMESISLDPVTLQPLYTPIVNMNDTASKFPSSSVAGMFAKFEV